MPAIRVKTTGHDKVYKFDGTAKEAIEQMEEQLRAKGVDV